MNDEIAVFTIEGAEESSQDITIEDPSKSVWDGLELLGVPLVLAVLGAWFQKTQQEQADRIAREQREQDNQIAKEQREQDGDETREEVLQLYFDRISALLIDRNLMAIAAKKEAFDEIKKEGINAKSISSFNFPNMAIRDEEVEIYTMRKVASPLDYIRYYLEGDNARGIKDVLGFSQVEQELLEVATDVIQARTLSILRRFEQDPERKSSVIRFLVEADVIDRLKISLSGTNLSGADLSSAKLIKADLDYADLKNANLIGAKLRGAKLRDAKLHNAKMVGVDLRNASLSDAKLIEADLSHVDLSEAYLNCADLSDIKLCRAEMHNVSMFGSDLINADLSDAKLIMAKLIGADLSGANLSNTDLRYADLNAVQGLTKEQLSSAKLCNTKLPSHIDLDPNRDCLKSQQSDQTTD